MNVNFEVTDTKRAILFVHKGCGNVSMIVFTPDGKGNIVNDTKCVDQVKLIMASTPGFDIVYDREAYVLDVDVNDGAHVNDGRRKFDSHSGISFPVMRKEYWERALNQAQQDHERKESIQQDVHGENQNTFEHLKVKVPPKPYEPTKEERQTHEATHCPFRAWCEICVKAKSLDQKHAKQVVNLEHIPVIEFDYAFATDTPGGPKISMMVATDSIHGSNLAVVARGKGYRTDEFLLTTRTGAMKTRCVRRLEGDNAWDLQFLNLCVGSPWNATARARSRNQQSKKKDELESGRRAKRVYLRQNILDKYGRTAGCPCCVGNGQHTGTAEQELNKKWWTKVMQLSSRHLQIRKKLCQNLMSE